MSYYELWDFLMQENIDPITILDLLLEYYDVQSDKARKDGRQDDFNKLATKYSRIFAFKYRKVD